MGWKNCKKNYKNTKKNFKKLINYFLRVIKTSLSLKFSQIFFRILKKLKRYYYYYTINFCDFNNIKISDININNFELILSKPESYDFKNEFFFLNRAHKINIKKFPKNNVPNKLWNYNLNYFDYINSTNSIKYKDNIIKLLNTWINNNNLISLENDPYPTSLRIVNWIKWSRTNNFYDEKFIKSLKIQSYYLSKNIEFDLLANHLMSNIKALIFLGYYFQGRFANKILKYGLKLLKSQILEQINEDGSHCELSPMYHSIVLEDLLEILHLINKYKSENKVLINLLNNRIHKMLYWLENMTFYNKVTFFNDSCEGVANKFEDLIKLANNCKIKYVSNLYKEKFVNYFEKSGYTNLKFNNTRIIFDVGNVGYKFNPGHSHADCLSLEMMIYNKKILVNSGISTYENIPLRHYQRSTQSHNTVTINNKNSSDVWGAFRVSKKANQVKDKLNISETSKYIEITAAHSGYSTIFNNTIHKRKVRIEENQVIIHDHIIGKFYNAVAYYYLHPEVIIKNNNKLKLKNKEIDIVVNNAKISFVKSKWYPEFGKEIDNYCMKLEFIKNIIEFKLIFNS